MLSVLASLGQFYRSSIGKKLIVALTGGALVLFVLGHMIGNLLIFMGPDELNGYAHFLKHLGLGMGVWVARIGLLAAVVLHVAVTIQLTIANRAARTDRYARPQEPQRSTMASRWMIVSGSIILAFIGLHLIHFTLPMGQDSRLWMDAKDRPDVYMMVVNGFRNPFISIGYVISIGLLCWHLSHGVASMFQTLGLSTPKTAGLFQLLAYGFAALIFIGNISMPIAVLVFGLGGDLEIPTHD